MRLHPVPTPSDAEQLESELAWSYRYPVPPYVRASGWWRWSGAACWYRQAGKSVESAETLRRDLVALGVAESVIPVGILDLRAMLTQVQDDAREREKRPVTSMGVVWESQ